MIQLNLLPDVKLEYIKAQRSRRLVITVSIMVSAVAVTLLVLLLLTNGLQKKHLNDLTKDIKSESSQLQQKPQIGKILTVQNQLESLTALHAGKPAASRLFDYLNSVTPAPVAIGSLTVDFGQKTASIQGSADALASVNKYIDTLKFTTYTTDTDNQSGQTKAFNNIVLSSFALSSDSSITQKVKLDVPSLTTTRAQVGNPTDLFQASQPTSKGGQ
jgi:hypothetical protein